MYSLYLLLQKPLNFLPNYENPCWYPDDSDKISCAPYFLQIGMSKCATSDLFARLILHPDIVPINGANGKNKSITWWNLRLTGNLNLSCTGSIWAVKLHLLDNMLLYTVTDQHMIHVEQRSETGTNVDFTEYTMKNDENDACFCFL